MREKLTRATAAAVASVALASGMVLGSATSAAADNHAVQVRAETGSVQTVANHHPRPRCWWLPGHYEWRQVWWRGHFRWIRVWVPPQRVCRGHPHHPHLG